MLAGASYCVQLITGLLNSLFKKFNGLLLLIGFKTPITPFFNPLPVKEGKRFNDEIYLLAPTLDPTVKLSWVAEECTFLNADEKINLKEKNSSKNYCNAP